MKITVRPLNDPMREIDVTRELISALAAALWRDAGGNDVLNWLEAEVHLERLITGAADQSSAAALPGRGRSRRARCGRFRLTAKHRSNLRRGKHAA